jgi:hypothetical protein
MLYYHNHVVIGMDVSRLNIFLSYRSIVAVDLYTRATQCTGVDLYARHHPIN